MNATASIVNGLASVRSRRAEEVLRLLRRYADALNQPASFTAGLGLQASDFAVAQWVSDGEDATPRLPRAFWQEYCEAGGAAEIIWATDGPGQLGAFL